MARSSSIMVDPSPIYLSSCLGFKRRALSYWPPFTPSPPSSSTFAKLYPSANPTTIQEIEGLELVRRGKNRIRRLAQSIIQSLTYFSVVSPFFLLISATMFFASASCIFTIFLYAVMSG
jgi:hypothetical protein